MTQDPGKLLRAEAVFKGWQTAPISARRISNCVYKSRRGRSIAKSWRGAHGTLRTWWWNIQPRSREVSAVTSAALEQRRKAQGRSGMVDAQYIEEHGADILSSFSSSLRNFILNVSGQVPKTVLPDQSQQWLSTAV